MTLRMDEETNESKICVIARRLDQYVKKMKCSGATGVGIENFKDIKVGVNPEDVHVTPTIDTIDEKEILMEEVEKGTVSGQVSLQLQSCSIKGTFRDGARHGHCEISFSEGKVEQISGEYLQGKLNGKVKVKFRDKTLLVGYFKAGVLHGFGRYFDEAGRLTFAGDHSNGVARGVCWQIIQGGGCVVGPVDDEGRHTGPDIMYLYPDFRTGYIGSFRAGQFLSGHEADLVDYFTDKAGILVPVLLPRIRDISHTRRIGIFGNIEEPEVRLRDPYESRHVYVSKSGVAGGQEGLFARRHLELNTIVAFYNGEKVRPSQVQSDSWEDNNYKIYDPSDYPQGTIDIPSWAQVLLSNCKDGR